MLKRTFTRRHMLGTAGASIGGAMIWSGLAGRSAHADGPDVADQKRVIYVNFDGGWDTLMSFDPRDHRLFGDPIGSIYTGYDILAQSDSDTDTLLKSGDGSGLIMPSGSNIAFGPAIGELQNRYADMCVLRGVNMGTLTHEVGRRYFLTGKFPSGLNASGSSIGTVVAGQCPDVLPLPNMVIGGGETYNASYDPKASGIVITSNDDLGFVLKAINAPYTLDPASQAAVANYIAHTDCFSDQLDGEGMVGAYRASWEKSQVLMEGTLFEHFNFKWPATDQNMVALYAAFDITSKQELKEALDGPIGQGLIAAQAITQDVAQAISIQPSPRLDHHASDWADLHLPAQRDAFFVINRLVGWLKNHPHPKGGSYFDETIILLASDFARTPTINVRGGRDHHLASTCVVMGGGIAGNQVIGATTDDTFAAQPVNLKTGKVGQGGHIMRPPDVHATIFQALGIPYDHLSNQSPVIIDKMLG